MDAEIRIDGPNMCRLRNTICKHCKLEAVDFLQAL